LLDGSGALASPFFLDAMLRADLERRTLSDDPSAFAIPQFWAELANGNIWWDLKYLRHMVKQRGWDNRKVHKWVQAFWSRIAMDVPEAPAAPPANRPDMLNESVCSTLALLTFYWWSVDIQTPFPEHEAVFYRY